MFRHWFKFRRDLLQSTLIYFYYNQCSLVKCKNDWENNARNRIAHVFIRRRSNQNWTNGFSVSEPSRWKTENGKTEAQMPSHEKWTASAHNVFHVIVYRRPISNVNTQHTAFNERGNAFVRCGFPYFSYLTQQRPDELPISNAHTTQYWTFKRMKNEFVEISAETRLSAHNGLTNFSSCLLRIFEGKMNAIISFISLGIWYFFVSGTALITFSKYYGLRCWDICDFFPAFSMLELLFLLTLVLFSVHVQNAVIIRMYLSKWKKRNELPAFDCVPERVNGNRMGPTS